MSKKQTIETEQTAEFDLKHRVTGAAVLLFLGALVFPWLLGPPSQASKLEVSKETLITSEVEAANIITSTGDSGVTTAAKEVEETVYISRITPLDAKGNSGLIQAANEAARSALKSKAEQDTENVLGGVVDGANSSIESASTDAKKANVISDTDAKDNEIAVPAPVAVKPNTAEQEQTRRETELQAALVAEVESQKAQEPIVAKPPVSKPSAVDVGWVVQVGLFTEKSRAIALISELKSQGLNASSSVVDTNRGKNTGTRVWLGPFTKRASAIKEQEQLKSKAGKDGFIRVYP